MFSQIGPLEGNKMPFDGDSSEVFGGTVWGFYCLPDGSLKTESYLKFRSSHFELTLSFAHLWWDQFVLNRLHAAEPLSRLAC